jgi:hypothetical protein
LGKKAIQEAIHYVIALEVVINVPVELEQIRTFPANDFIGQKTHSQGDITNNGQLFFEVFQ